MIENFALATGEGSFGTFAYRLVSGRRVCDPSR